MCIKDYFDRMGILNRYTGTHIKDPIEYYDNELKLMLQHLNKISCLLDIGCGSGLFLQAIENTIKIDKICALDVSIEMIKKAFITCSSNNIIFCQGDALRLPFKKHFFTLVHTESLLHHLIAETRTKSRNLASMAIKEMLNVLKSNGFLLLTEIYYESYGSSSVTSHIIFTLLSFLNKLNIKLPIEEAPKGLIVSFYTRSELEEIIKSINGVILKKLKKGWKVGFKERIALLNKRGKITYLVKFKPH